MKVPGKHRLSVLLLAAKLEKRDVMTVACRTDCAYLVLDTIEVRQSVLQKLALPMRTLLADMPFFKDLAPSVQDKVPEIVQYACSREGTVIYRQGDEPDLCYIILSGEVSAWKRAETSENDSRVRFRSKPQVENVQASVIQSPVADNVRRRCSVIHTELSQDDDEDDVSEVFDGSGGSDVATENFGTMTSTLGSGTLFGESGLIEDSPRSSTIVCNEDCEFLTINRPDFERVVMSTMSQAKLPSHIKRLILDVPFFNSLKPAVRDRIPYVMTYRFLPRGSVLLSEGETPDRLYLILGGLVSVWKSVDMDVSMEEISFDELCSKGSGKPECGCESLTARCVALLDYIAEVVVSNRTPCTSPVTSTVHRQSLCSVIGVTKHRYGVQVARLGQGIICLERAMLGEPDRGSTFACETDCHFLCISREDFDLAVKADLVAARMLGIRPQLKSMLMEMPCFKELDRAMQDIIPDVVKYTTRPAGSVLFEQDDPAAHCYIVLSGEVLIWKREVQQGSKDNGPSYEEDTMTVAIQKPSVEQALSAAREKCASIAHLLGNDQVKDLRQGDSIGNTSLLFYAEKYGTPIVALGPGAMFGETALLTDNPRNASATCFYACEFLAIETAGFEKVLMKHEMEKLSEKKRFLFTYFPGLQKLPEAKLQSALYQFNEESYPINHTFLTQGQDSDGSIYFIIEGSVEFVFQAPAQTRWHLPPPSRRLGILVKGGVFGAVAPKAWPNEPLTVAATSSPCIVLHVAPDGLKRLPDALTRQLRDVVYQTAARQLAQCSRTCPNVPPLRTPSMGSPPSRLAAAAVGVLSKSPAGASKSKQQHQMGSVDFQHRRLNEKLSRQASGATCGKISPPLSATVESYFGRAEDMDCCRRAGGIMVGHKMMTVKRGGPLHMRPSSSLPLLPSALTS